MGTTSLTFQISGVSELLGYIDRIQSKMAGLDQSMSKQQLSNEMQRVERLVKEAGTFANTLFSSLKNLEGVNLNRTADGLQKVGKEAVDSSGKVVESSNKAAAAAKKSSDAITQAATKSARAHKSAGQSASATSQLYDKFAGSIAGVVTGYASIQSVLTVVNAAFQENNRIIQEAAASMQNYAKVSGQLGQKAESTQQLGEYRNVVNQLATSGAVTNREAATEIAYAMLSANLPISEVQKMDLPLRARLMNSSDMSALIKASGPLMTFDKNVKFTELMSMAMAASKLNVSDTSKIIEGVADSSMMNQQLGTTTEESFAIADVIAQSTHNANEARVWQKNFTKDVWKKVLAKAAFAKMKEIDPNAETMEGFITGYDSKGNPEIDPSFRMTFTEFGEWAKGYYGQDKTRLRKDFADIRGGQGALAVMEALTDGRFAESLQRIRQARQTNEAERKAKATLAVSKEIRLSNAKAAAQAKSDIANEADAAIKETLWKIAEQQYESAATTSGGKMWRGWQNWANRWFNPSSYSREGQARQLWNSGALSREQKNEVIFQYALANPDLDVRTGMQTEKHERGQARQTDGFYTAVWQAQKQIKAGATQYTPVSGSGAYDEKSVVDMAKAAENAANALNKAADAADKAANKLQSQVMPTPGQTGALAPVL